MDRKTLSSWTSQHVIEIFFMFAEVVTLKCLSWMHTFEFHLFRNGKKKQCWVQVRSRESKSLGPKNTLLHLLAYSNQVVLLQCPCWVSWYLTAYENNSENCKKLAVAAKGNTHAYTRPCIHMSFMVSFSLVDGELQVQTHICGSMNWSTKFGHVTWTR